MKDGLPAHQRLDYLLAKVNQKQQCVMGVRQERGCPLTLVSTLGTEHSFNKVWVPLLPLAYHRWCLPLHQYISGNANVQSRTLLPLTSVRQT